MIPDVLGQYFAAHQTALWLTVVVVDLGLTLVLYRLWGKMGLYAVVVLDVMLCNMLGPKLTVVMGFNTTLGAIIYSGIYFATDLLGERYGQREANRAVMIGFAASVLTVAFSQLSLQFAPSPDPDVAVFAGKVHEAQGVLFAMTPRFVFGSLLAYLISQTHDVWLYHVIKRRTGRKHLWLRNNGSTIVSQGIDTVVYALVVWWGVVDLQTALELGAVKYLFKVIIALLDTPFIYMARRWDVHERDWSYAADDHPDPSRRPPV